MSKFKIKQYYTGGNLIDNILKRSGIKDKNKYLKPTYKSLGSPYDYTMMKESVEFLREHLILGSRIGILVDCDVDGYTSSAIIYKAMKKISDNNIKIFHHNDKQHGLSDGMFDKIVQSHDEVELDLLIIPDAGSNDHERRKKLGDIGISTLVIDHHIIEDESRLVGASKYTVNNQRSDNLRPNPHLVGAGVVLKFVEALYEECGIRYNNQFYDLAAVGQIADMSDLTDPEVRYIVTYGLENIKTNLFNTIIDEKIEGLTHDLQDELYPIDIAFNVAPLINAVTRVGTIDEKELLFNSLIEENLRDEYVVERRRKIRGHFRNVELTWTPYEYTFDIIDKVKNRQDNLVKRIESDLIDSIDDNNGVIIAILEEFEDGDETVIGLVANRLSARFEKPTIVLREDDEDVDVLTGSIRGYENSSIKDFRSFILKSGLAIFVRGHDNAAGVKFTKENLMKFDRYVTDNLKEVKVDDSMAYVDKIETKVDITRVQYGHYLRALTNHNVDDVLYGYKNIRINPTFVRSRGSVTTIWEQGLEFIIFNDHSTIGNWLRRKKGFQRVDIVGKPTMNYWRGSGKPQIVVERIQLSE